MLNIAIEVGSIMDKWGWIPNISGKVCRIDDNFKLRLMPVRSKRCPRVDLSKVPNKCKCDSSDEIKCYLRDISNACVYKSCPDGCLDNCNRRCPDRFTYTFIEPVAGTEDSIGLIKISDRLNRLKELPSEPTPVMTINLLDHMGLCIIHEESNVREDVGYMAWKGFLDKVASESGDGGVDLNKQFNGFKEGESNVGSLCRAMYKLVEAEDKNEAVLKLIDQFIYTEEAITDSNAYILNTSNLEAPHGWTEVMRTARYMRCSADHNSYYFDRFLQIYCGDDTSDLNMVAADKIDDSKKVMSIRIKKAVLESDSGLFLADIRYQEKNISLLTKALIFAILSSFIAAIGLVLQVLV